MGEGKKCSWGKFTGGRTSSAENTVPWDSVYYFISNILLVYPRLLTSPPPFLSFPYFGAKSDPFVSIISGAKYLHRRDDKTPVLDLQGPTGRHVN